MVEMLPAWVPLRLSIIYFTGVLELFIGLALFLPKYQINAAKAAVLVFMIFFPANIYAAINGVGLGGHQWGAIYLLIRLPLQLILIAWAYYLCVKSHNKSISRPLACLLIEALINTFSLIFKQLAKINLFNKWVF